MSDVELVKFADQSNYVDINSYINIAPTTITLESSSVSENSISNFIANISGYDPDDNTLTYTVLSDYDGGMLEVDGSVMKKNLM